MVRRSAGLGSYAAFVVRRDRDFESPQHASECHEQSAVPGYVDYGTYHGATLKGDIEAGRFVFFFLPVDLES